MPGCRKQKVFWCYFANVKMPLLSAYYPIQVGLRCISKALKRQSNTIWLSTEWRQQNHKLKRAWRNKRQARHLSNVILVSKPFYLAWDTMNIWARRWTFYNYSLDNQTELNTYKTHTMFSSVFHSDITFNFLQKAFYMAPIVPLAYQVVFCRHDAYCWWRFSFVWCKI